MVTVGLTGGIGSGKSTVVRLLAGHGAVVVDADVVAREVVAPGSPGLAAVAAEFGAGVLAADGSLDRPALAEVVFNDPERLAALNAIVHPLVAERSAALQAAAPADSVVVHDVPLLTENGLAGRYDLVVVVDVPEELQLDRLTRLRGMTPQEARGRMAAQAERGERLAVADVVVPNTGTTAELADRVAELWHELAARAAAGPPAAGR
ncbi:dephospho-CoA kinase [Streptomyces lonarensis]|uniref:Dephospho-CoA kinase n=1 Tax=Streptomyces lonarensis TaxID=700599 RepID=A0A7X6HZ15_9ACTN|nr:dephospho-CoA kinase [Streptomyces lonarensis]NJQ06193.1 dephospho-CoA kinase [Streptomyces lonarensis]